MEISKLIEFFLHICTFHFSMKFSLSFQNAKLLRTFIFIIFYVIVISLASCGPGGGGERYSISGRVTSDGSGLAGVTMALTGTGSASTTTDSNGTYQFTGLSNGSYVITPSKAGYVFTPTSRSVSISNANITGQDFGATAVNWAKTYGGGNDDVAHSIQQTLDSGFIVAGETYSFGVVNADIWVFKLNSNGAIQWEKTYGGSGYDFARSIRQTSDGGYIVAGETSSFGANTEVWVLKLDADGNIQWQKTYGGPNYDIAHSIQQTSNGGFIVAGETNSFGSGDYDVWVLKLDSNGIVEWQTRYGGSGDDIAYSIQQTSDGGYIVAGETGSFGAGLADFWVLKLNSSGVIEWQKTYGGLDDDVAHSIQQTTPDGGYIVAGETESFGAGFADFWVLKLDSNGDVVWQKTYGGGLDDKAYTVQQTSDGGYVIAGKSSLVIPVLSDMWVLKLYSNGNIEWQKTYGGDGSNSANFIRQTSDGGYIVGGETSLFGAGNADVWVLKLDKNGNIGSVCGIIGTSNATVTTTIVTAVDSLATVTPTNAGATPTSILPQNSTAATDTQCSYP